MRANYHRLGGLLWLHLGDSNTAHLLLWPTNGTLLVQFGQNDSGGTKCLIMPTKQITSEQPLVEVTRANGNICNVNLQGGCQQKNHAGHTYNLDHCTIGAQDILSRLFLHGQAVGVHPLLYQQGDGRARVAHHKAFSGLALGLVTLGDLPGSNAYGDVWLISLLLSFSRLRLWLRRLEPACRQMYLLDDQDVRHSNQGAWRVGYWGLWHSRWRHDDWCSYNMQVVVLNLFFAMDTMAFQAAVGTLCTNSSSYFIACPVPSPVSLLVRLVIAEVS